MVSWIRSRAALVCCIALVCLAASPAAVAAQRNVLGIVKAPQPGQISADRPSFGENIGLIPQGYFEAEGGFRFDDDQGGGQSYTPASSVLWRTGVASNIELRLGFDGYTFNDPGHSGPGNASVGAKIHLVDEGRYIPALDVLPTVSLPVGDHQIASPKAEPELHFIWNKYLSENITLGGNLNFAERAADDKSYYREIAASIAGGYSLTDNLSSYIEYYGIFPEGRDRRASDVIDGGLSYLTSDRTQLDIYAGTGLNNSESNVYAGFGIAHLF